jgi:hypothetical protein
MMGVLSIHVINAGVGESIIVGLPNDKWGVIDCYASNLADPSSNQTLRFLRKQNVSSLEFLCLTHPHYDHFRGLKQLLERFNVRYFWRFGAFSSIDLKRTFLRYIQISARGSGEVDLIEDADELEWSLAEPIRRLKASKIEKIIFLADVKHLYPFPPGSEPDIEIKSIAPSSNSIVRYQDELYKCFDDQKMLVNRLPFQRHNDVSAAISIRYRKARVILCGDVEVKSWKDIEDDLDPNELAAVGVKVSHHGSTTGYTPNSWAQFSASQKPYAIVTPFRRFGLPKKEALEHIRANTTVLMTTCRAATPQGDSQDFLFSRPRGLRTQAFLRGRFKAWHDYEPSAPAGICSMFFKADGSCTYSCAGDACEIN